MGDQDNIVSSEVVPLMFDEFHTNVPFDKVEEPLIKYEDKIEVKMFFNSKDNGIVVYSCREDAIRGKNPESIGKFSKTLSSTQKLVLYDCY